MKQFISKHRQIKLPIALKLIFLTGLVVISAITLHTWQMTNIFREVSDDREVNYQQQLVEAKANEIDTTMVFLYQRLTSMSQSLAKGSLSEDFEQSGDFLYLRVEDLTQLTSLEKTRPQPDLELIAPGLDASAFPRYVDNLNQERESLKTGKSLLFSTGKFFSLPMVLIAAPLSQTNGVVTSLAWGVLRPEVLQKFVKNMSDVTIVDSSGASLADSQEKRLFALASKSEQGSLREFINMNAPRLQQKFKHGLLLSVAKTKNDLFIISRVSLKFLIAPIQYVYESTYFILGIILSVSFFFVVIVAHTFSTNIEKIVDLTKEVAHGKFHISAAKKIRSHDEVGALAIALDEMAHDLEEREKIKGMFSKFHGTEVTETILRQGDLLKGERRKVVVFFSDIRGFTSFSEGREPEAIVQMLNEYFGVMVAIIQKHGGVVDKFVGDAIMAIWGAPKSKQDDEALAIKACLEMRIQLSILNARRINRNESPLLIGMGLHTGYAVAGTIGSEQRMEYTVIGDTVNTASRLEAATKNFGTDLLVSEELTTRNGQMFIFSKAGNIVAKGKSKPIDIYRVEGVLQDGKKLVIETPFSSYAAENSDKIKLS